jgi:signal peptidase I
MAELMAGGLLAVLLIVALRWRLRVVTVSGESMAPAYHDGDQLLVVRSRRRVRIGAVIVFVPPAGFTEMPWLVKRVVGLKGDRRSERFIVRGDAAVSLDSRQFGPVDRGAVIGVVVRRMPGQRVPIVPGH